MNADRDNYVPTMRLRFVERHNDPRSFDFTSRILQQWWANLDLDPNPLGEWRDVPVERI